MLVPQAHHHNAFGEVLGILYLALKYLAAGNFDDCERLVGSGPRTHGCSLRLVIEIPQPLTLVDDYLHLIGGVKADLPRNLGTQSLAHRMQGHADDTRL